MIHYNQLEMLENTYQSTKYSGICVSPILTQNEGVWNFHGSLTLNQGKLI